MRAVKRAGGGLKEELRAQTLAAGLPYKLSTTWQDVEYPKVGRSPTPAAVVYSKAPKIIQGYALGATIVARAGRRLLAIPTDATPLKNAGGPRRSPRAKTPIEVENQYGRRLRFVPARSAEGMKVGGRAVGFLIMDNVVARKSTGRYRAASDREIAGTGRDKGRRVESVVMFTLVASVKVPKKLDLKGALDRAAATLPQLLAEEWAE